MQDRLEQILLRKRAEIESFGPEAQRWQREAGRANRVFRSLAHALKKPERISLIAEIKRASPSAGPIAPDCDPVKQALLYADAGADAISVLTDQQFFSGSLADLLEVRRNVDLPLLRKDFILAPAQLYQSVLWGADAVLLIVAALSPSELYDLHSLAADLGLESLVEVHDPAELEEALRVGAKLIGVNHRNLRTLAVDITASERVLGRVPEDCVAIGESGIVSGSDARRLRALGADAILVGESLMRSADPKGKIAELRGFGKKPERRGPG